MSSTTSASYYSSTSDFLYKRLPMIGSIAQPALCALPIDCRQAILCQLSEMSALKSAILAHPALYAAFVDRKERIVHSVMSQCLPQDLLPDAVFEYSAAALEKSQWTREAVLSLIEQHGAHQIPPSFKWTPESAVYMQRFYRHVEFFTSDFIGSALDVYPALQNGPLSSSEWCRVARSFYRVEIYRHLFRRRDHVSKKSSPDFPYHEQNELYYERFAAFELEQLACVSEHLFRKVTKRMYSQPFSHVEPDFPDTCNIFVIFNAP